MLRKMDQNLKVRQQKLCNHCETTARDLNVVLSESWERTREKMEAEKLPEVTIEENFSNLATDTNLRFKKLNTHQT